jgi:spore germination protein GerM
VTRRRAAAAAAGGLALALVVMLVVALTRRGEEPRPAAPPESASAPESGGRKIKAQLFYVAEEGRTLTSVERDVPYADGTAAQAREIVSAQLAPVEEPLVSAVPPGTALRALFVTAAGDAYVDLSREVASAHPGGSTYERLTIYTIVDALTVNLPAIRAVQILVDGREVDSLAGHVSLRGPLARSREWTP